MFEFLFKWKKKKSKFEILLTKFNSDLNKKRFDKSLSKYVELRNSYDSLDMEKKEEFDDSFSLVREQMILYMKMKELSISILGNDLELIKSGLNLVFEIRSRIEGIPKLMNFVDKNYRYSSKVYQYKLARKEFNSKLSEVHTLIRERSFDNALIEFKDLLFYFKEMEKYSTSSNVGLYSKLIDLKEHINLNLLESKAYGEPAKYKKVKRKKK